VRPEGRQGKRALAWPDALTLARLPLAAVFLAVEEPVVRAAVLAVAALSDLLDGWLARRLGGSRLGPALDPVADKLFMAAGFWVVLTSGLLNPFEIGAVLLRDIVALFAFLTTVVVGPRRQGRHGLPAAHPRRVPHGIGPDPPAGVGHGCRVALRHRRLHARRSVHPPEGVV
jgi:phosphatidylglycerophosphate synthase